MDAHSNDSDIKTTSSNCSSSSTERRGGLYTIGYAQWNPEEIKQLLVQHDSAMLIDTRLKPYSRTKHWCKDQLEEYIGRKSYMHLECLGNVNYGGRGSKIQLKRYLSANALLGVPEAVLHHFFKRSVPPRA